MPNDTPIYPWWDQVPPHLRTKTQLEQAGFKPAGPVRGLVRYHAHGTLRQYDLYDQTEARPKRKLTVAQRQALAAAQRARRTCADCRVVVERPSHLDRRRRCPACRAADVRLYRVRERDATVLWARELLRRDDWLLLDTETTGLADAGGVLVEIAIVRPDGSVLFESLVNPLTEIAPEAQAVHGLTVEQLVAAPTFAELEPQLRALLDGRTVITYNAIFDRTILQNELQRLSRPTAPRWDATLRQAMQWTDASEWQCAMEQYACLVGDWHPYYGSYRYQPLPHAGHRAVEDCRACLQLIQRMAAMPLSWDVLNREEGGVVGGE